MINKNILQMIAALIFMTFLPGCGKGGNTPFITSTGVQTWNGVWISSNLVSSGTFSLTVSQTGTASSGSMTMGGSPCFSTSPITGWTVSGNTVSWSSPEIGDFAGTISGAAISGTFSVTSAGACFGDTGVFSITS